MASGDWRCLWWGGGRGGGGGGRGGEGACLMARLSHPASLSQLRDYSLPSHKMSGSFGWTRDHPGPWISRLLRCTFCPEVEAKKLASSTLQGQATLRS